MHHFRTSMNHTKAKGYINNVTFFAISFHKHFTAYFCICLTPSFSVSCSMVLVEVFMICCHDKLVSHNVYKNSALLVTRQWYAFKCSPANIMPIESFRPVNCFNCIISPCTRFFYVFSLRGYSKHTTPRGNEIAI